MGGVMGVFLFMTLATNRFLLLAMVSSISLKDALALLDIPIMDLSSPLMADLIGLGMSELTASKAPWVMVLTLTLYASTSFFFSTMKSRS
jgi:hypothetical protein